MPLLVLSGMALVTVNSRFSMPQRKTGCFWDTMRYCSAMSFSPESKCFYKLPKCRLAGKFQMCFHEKAVRSRWCLSPVLKCSVGTLRALCIHCVVCKRVQAQACCFHGRHFGFASASITCNF